jgi:hypothetical protein
LEASEDTLMSRLHLFELEDVPWFPSLLRDGTTQYLEAIQRIVGLPQLFAPKLKKAIERARTHSLVDLGSGAGGPVRQAAAAVERELRETLDVTLTDLRPNQRTAKAIEALGNKHVRYLRKAIDASDVPPELAGVRTMFASSII